jgi:hypothetical protein
VKKSQEKEEGEKDGQEAPQEDDQEGASQVHSLWLLRSASQLCTISGQPS